MDPQGQTIVVTGAASGIGRALAGAFAQAGARVIVSDRDEPGGEAVAREIGARFVAADVSQEAAVIALIENVLAREGVPDLFVSNAGIGLGEGPETPDEAWDLVHRVNVMSHIWAARRLLPLYLERGRGYFLNVSSAAGLLTELHSAPYAVSKHGALAFAEWLAITYHARGVRVTCLCPEGVLTPMTEHLPSLRASAVSTDVVVEHTLAALREERFLVTTHPTTLPAFRSKAADYDGWLGAMRGYRVRAMQMLADHLAGLRRGRPGEG